MKRGQPPAHYLHCEQIGIAIVNVHLVTLMEGLEARGVHFTTTEDGLSTKGSTGKLVLNILGSIAQFERNLMLERTRAGLAAARAKGRVGGRRRKMLPADVTRARSCSLRARSTPATWPGC